MTQTGGGVPDATPSSSPPEVTEEEWVDPDAAAAAAALAEGSGHAGHEGPAVDDDTADALLEDAHTAGD